MPALGYGLSLVCLIVSNLSQLSCEAAQVAVNLASSVTANFRGKNDLFDWTERSISAVTLDWLQVASFDYGVGARGPGA